MRRKLPVATLFFFCALGLAIAGNAEQIERERVRVMAGPGSFYPLAGELQRGATVEVRGHKGPWAEIAAGELEGFIPRSALGAKKGGGGLAGLGRAFGSQEASVSSETAGVKGFSDDVEKAHAEKRGLDWSAVVELDAQKVSPDQVRAFLRARGLAGGGTGR